MSWRASGSPQTRKTARFSVFEHPAEIPHVDDGVRASDVSEPEHATSKATTSEGYIMASSNPESSYSRALDPELVSSVEPTSKAGDFALSTATLSPSVVQTECQEHTEKVEPLQHSPDIPQETACEGAPEEFISRDSKSVQTARGEEEESCLPIEPSKPASTGDRDEGGILGNQSEQGASQAESLSTLTTEPLGVGHYSNLTRDEKLAMRKFRRASQLEAGHASQSSEAKLRKKSGRRNRRGRMRKLRPLKPAGQGSTDQGKNDEFDAWVGDRLKAWYAGDAVSEEEQMPPEGYGVVERISFDLKEDEIAFPTSLSALQRRQVHGWAMQLALFHASSGDGAERHVIVSKTGFFHGKALTRGGHMRYKEGVPAPTVERFALRPGHEKDAKPLITALHSFTQEIQQRDRGFTTWLRKHVPGELDGSDLEEARRAMVTWPPLSETEWEYVDTPGKLAKLEQELASCKEFGFDVEAHNARTFYGLTCLLQISTAAKDYVVDPLARDMWDSIPELRAVFANPEILKIGHSIRSCDVPGLYRDFGIVVVNGIDTEEAAHALGDKYSGLVKLLEIAGVEEQGDMGDLKKIMQMCDWRERPLDSENLEYARLDSHYLIPLWRMMRARLLAEDSEASREEAREAKELEDLRRQEAAQQRRVEQARSREGQVHQVEPSEFQAGVEVQEPRPLPSTVSDDLTVDLGQGAWASGVRPESPAPGADEHWELEWDSPSQAHKRERARSGSFFRSDLGSISESAFEGEGGREGDVEGERESLSDAYSPGEKQLAVACLEEEEGDDDDDEGEVMMTGASMPHGGISTNHELAYLNRLDDDMEISLLADEDDDADDEGYDDEDDDLWEGWGEQPQGDGVAVESKESTEMAEMAKTAVERTEEGNQDEETTLLPTNGSARTDPSEADEAQAKLIPSLVINGNGRSEQPTRAGDVEASLSKPAIDDLEMWAAPQRFILQTDGVRLLWKALCRTQIAAGVLWRVPPEARREGAHKERHFRTAVQRLIAPRWSDVNVHVYEEVFLWRDRTARRLDDGVMYVCPGDILIDIAVVLPTTVDALRRISAPLSPVLGTGDTPEAVDLVKVVRAALGLPEEEEVLEQEPGTEAASRVEELAGGGEQKGATEEECQLEQPEQPELKDPLAEEGGESQLEEERREELAENRGPKQEDQPVQDAVAGQVRQLAQDGQPEHEERTVVGEEDCETRTVEAVGTNAVDTNAVDTPSDHGLSVGGDATNSDDQVARRGKGGSSLRVYALILSALAFALLAVMMKFDWM